MSQSNSTKSLLIIIGILLLTNIALLFFLVTNKRPFAPSHKDEKVRMADRLKKEVGFSEAQLATYLAMREKQKAAMRPKYDAMRQAKDSLFKKISDPSFPDSLIDSYARSIGEKQEAVDKQTFIYFRNVRALCTPEQLPKYDTLVQDVFKKMSRWPGPPREGDKGKKK